MNREEIQNAIDKLDKDIAWLQTQRKNLVQQRLEWDRGPTDAVHGLVDYIQQHPGCNKQDLLVAFADSYSESELNKLITQARRNWNFIENRGTRRAPRWYIK